MGGVMEMWLHEDCVECDWSRVEYLQNGQEYVYEAPRCPLCGAETETLFTRGLDDL